MVVFDKTKGIGRLVTDRFDFEKHIKGESFRHTASQIDTTAISGIASTNVQGVLQEIYTVSQGAAQFVVVGGSTYDMYATGTLNDTVPYFDPVLNDLFTNPSNPNYSRVQDGGLVFIKAGTYKISGTVQVPPGVTIMGEGAGARFVNLTVVAHGTGRALFNIKADPFRVPEQSVTGSVVGYDPFIAYKTTTLTNLVIQDNYPYPKVTGDLTYKDPQSTNIALVTLEQGGSLSCSEVLFLGRSNLTTSTAKAIDLTASVVSSYSTLLKVTGCGFDGFSVPVQFQTLNGAADHIQFMNNKVRAFGKLSGDSSGPGNNCFINSNAANITVSDNYFWGDLSTVLTLLYINDVVGTSLVFGNYSKIVVADNNVTINKSSSAALSTFKFIRYNTSIVSPGTKLTALDCGNNYNGNFQVSVTTTGTPQIVLTPSTFELGTHLQFTQTNAAVIGTNLSVSATTLTNSISTSITNNTATIINTVATINNNASATINNTAPTINYTAGFINFDGLINQVAGRHINLFLNVRTVTLVPFTSYTVVADDIVLLITTNAINPLQGQALVLLPTAASSTYRVLIIKDAAGAASTSPITIVPNGTDKIEGLNAGKAIDVDWGGLTIVSNGTDWLVI